MADDSETQVPLGNASVTLQNGDRRRFRVNAAILTARGKHRVWLTFEGPQGSVAINLSVLTSGGSPTSSTKNRRLSILAMPSSPAGARARSGHD